MAMRQNATGMTPKTIMSTLKKPISRSCCNNKGIHQCATLEDARYFFFSLPSIIIVKGYAHGFMHQPVQETDPATHTNA